MAVLSLTFARGVLCCVAAPGVPAARVLINQIRRLPPAVPIVVLIHGFTPPSTRRALSAHQTIFAPCSRHTAPHLRSWPEALGFSPDTVTDGLCIGFSWPSELPGDPPRAGLAARGGFARVYDRAGEAGFALADLIDQVHDHDPARQIDLVGHSLGARVALAALRKTSGKPGQILLLGGAEYLSVARAGLVVSAARAAQVYNITSRENRLYDLLLQRFGPPEHRPSPPLGQGMEDAVPGWIDIPLEHPGVRAACARRGILLSRPRWRISHRHFYLRPELFALYSNLLRGRDNWQASALLADMTATGAKAGPAAPRPLTLPARPAIAGPCGLKLAGHFGIPPASFESI